jgi:hypothetical protein
VFRGLDAAIVADNETILGNIQRLLHRVQCFGHHQLKGPYFIILRLRLQRVHHIAPSKGGEILKNSNLRNN